jgi:hypothetical protein
MIHPTKWYYNFVTQEKYCLLGAGIPRHNRKYLKELIYEAAKQRDAVYIGTAERYLCVKRTPLHV